MDNTITIGRIQLNKKLLYNTFVLLVFLTMDLYYFHSSPYVTIIRLFVLTVCTGLFLIEKKGLINIKILLFFFLFIITALNNTVVVGNQRLYTIIYLSLSFFVALFFLLDIIDETPFLIATYSAIFFILAKYITVGDMNAIFSDSSRNYVSIMLMFSLTLYYLKAKGRIKILPALMTFILCVIAIGRGGIISSGILLVSIILIKLYKERKRPFFLFVVFLLLLIILIYMLIITNSDIFSMSNMFDGFAERGMSDNGRLSIWIAYLLKCKESSMYILCGAPLSTIPEIVRFEGNIHNSVLCIHAYNGVLFLALIILLIVYSFCRAIKEKNFLYVVCFISFIVRGLTDSVFWGGSLGTPVFMTFLCFYLKRRNRCLFIKR